MAEAPDQPERKLDSSCPTCGAPAERGQLVCLECGSRIALAYRRPPSWKLPIAIVVGVGVLAMAGAVFAYEAIDDEAKEEVAQTPLKPKKTTETSDSQTSGQSTAKAEAEAEGRAQAAAASEGLVPKGDLYTWPRDLQAFTVVLLSTEDRASATTFAKSAAEAKDAKTGRDPGRRLRDAPQGLLRGVRRQLQDARAGRPRRRPAGRQVPGRVRPARQALTPGQ